MKTITLPTYNRIDILKQTLESIRCSVPEDWLLILGCDPEQTAVLKLCRAIDWMPAVVIADHEPYRVRVPPFVHNGHLYDWAFDRENSKLNLFLEDDHVLSPDAFKLIDWFWHLPNRDDFALLNLWNDAPRRDAPVDVIVDCSFASGANIMTRDKYRRYLKPRWLCDPRGWDWSVRVILKTENLKTLTPVLMRCHMIGSEGVCWRQPAYDAQLDVIDCYNECLHKEPFRIVDTL